MQLTGETSWRLELKDASECELALFVRDSLRLDPLGPGGEVPPLSGSVPDLGERIDADLRQGASEQWAQWWHQILLLQFGDGEQLADERMQGDARARMRMRAVHHQAVCDPPEFAALAARPALRAAARASFPAYLQWQSDQPEPARDSLVHPLDWELMKQTADDVAFDRGVDLGAVQAKVAIIAVDEVWWQRSAPGRVVCSRAAAGDPSAAQALLWDAFDSHVRSASG